MLEIKNLHARVADNEILRGINLTVNAGEVHAIMGPNGSGKSTLAGVLAGRDAFDVTEGEVLYRGQGPARHGPRGARPRGRLPRVPVPRRDPRRHATPTSCAPPSTPSASTAASRSSTPPRSSSSSSEKMKLLHIERRPAQAARQRGLLRRREEAQRDLPDGRARPEAVPSSTRPTPASTSTPCAPSPTASTPCAARTGPCSSSRTTSGC